MIHFNNSPVRQALNHTVRSCWGLTVKTRWRKEGHFNCLPLAVCAGITETITTRWPLMRLTCFGPLSPHYSCTHAVLSCHRNHFIVILLEQIAWSCVLASCITVRYTRCLNVILLFFWCFPFFYFIFIFSFLKSSSFHWTQVQRLALWPLECDCKCIKMLSWRKKRIIECVNEARSKKAFKCSNRVEKY